MDTAGRGDGGELAGIKALLQAVTPQPGAGLDQWMREAQSDLRRVARAERVAVAAGETLSTTALIHEAYLRFAQSGSRFVSRKHFFATAALAMRQILVDYARAQQAQKRGAGVAMEPLSAAEQLPDGRAHGIDLLAIDTALAALEQQLPRAAQVVQLRFFVGLGDAEIGEILGVDESTVRRDWLKARGLLHLHLEAG